MTRPEPADVQLPATYQSEAASELERPGDEATYQAILSAVMETARGRWFLAEYARRNRAADTELVLQALARLEARVTQETTAAPAPDPAMESAQSRPESASEGSTPDTAPRATPRAGDETVPEVRREPGSPAPETRAAASDPRGSPAPGRQLAAVAEQPRDTEKAEKAPDAPPLAGRLAQLSRWERQALFS